MLKLETQNKWLKKCYFITAPICLLCYVTVLWRDWWSILLMFLLSLMAFAVGYLSTIWSCQPPFIACWIVARICPKQSAKQKVLAIIGYVYALIAWSVLFGFFFAIPLIVISIKTESPLLFQVALASTVVPLLFVIIGNICLVIALATALRCKGSE